MLLRSLAPLVVGAILALPPVFAIPTIEAVGSKFFTSDGKQFFLKGTITSPLVEAPT